VEEALTSRAAIASTLSLADASLRRWDAVVLGAGPAGSMAALTLARAGRSGLLVDKARFPREKVCGCCLSGAALESIVRAGLLDEIRREGVPLERFAIHCGRARAEVPTRGVALSRGALDAMLVRAAVSAGAEFLPGTVGEVRRERSGSAAGEVYHAEGAFPQIRLRSSAPQSVVSSRVNSEAISIGPDALRTELCVVSDGLAGTALADDPPQVDPHSRIGLAATLESAGERGIVRMVCARDGYAGMVRLEDGRLHIAAALDPAFVRAKGGPASAVSSVISSAGVSPPANLGAARWHATPGLTRRRRMLYAPGLLVLGDAAAYVEPFTGEGIGWAISSGVAAAELVLAGRPEAWPDCHARVIAGRQRLCRAVATLLRRPALTASAVRMLSLLPRFANPFLRRVHEPILGATP
jgi:menaquinone-9 beta-reductase